MFCTLARNAKCAGFDFRLQWKCLSWNINHVSLNAVVRTSSQTGNIPKISRSRGNVLASRSNVREFKVGWGRWIFSGRKNHEHKSSRRDLKLGFPSLNLKPEKIGLWVKFNWHFHVLNLGEQNRSSLIFSNQPKSFYTGTYEENGVLIYKICLIDMLHY